MSHEGHVMVILCLSMQCRGVHEEAQVLGLDVHVSNVNVDANSVPWPPHMR